MERRQSKAVAPFSVDAPVAPEFRCDAGIGVSLGQLHHFEANVKKFTGTSDVLRSLHRILFPGQSVSKITVKKNLRLFSGFPFYSDASASDEHTIKQIDTVKDKLYTWKTPGLKDLCLLFGLPLSGDKEALVERIVAFLCNPTASAKPLLPKPKSRTKKSLSTTKNTVAKSNKHTKKTQSDDQDDSQEEPQTESSDTDKQHSDGDDANYGTLSPKKPKKQRVIKRASTHDTETSSPSKKSKKAKTATQLSKEVVDDASSDEEKASIQPSTATTAPPAITSPTATVSEQEDETSIVPEVEQQEGKQPPPEQNHDLVPTDDALKQQIRQILADSNLETLTKGKVRQQLKQLNQSHPMATEDWWAGKKQIVGQWVEELLDLVTKNTR